MSPGEPSHESKRRRDEALDWWARLDDGRLSRAENKAFKAWLVADAANRLLSQPAPFGAN
jgi:ferric-dicitrate binding protein FerR (iron transport regulator)